MAQQGGFDLASAQQHYSDTEIADYLGQQYKFDTAGARKAGYADADIIDHLMKIDSAAHAPKTQAPAEEPGLLSKTGHYLLGAGENAGAAIANIPGGIINAAADFGARATGHTGGAHPIPMVQPGQAGRDFGQAGADLLEKGLDAAGVGNATAHGVGATDTAAREAVANHPALANGAAALGDALQVIPAAAGIRSGVQTLRGVTSAAGDAATAAAQAASDAESSRLGFKTGRESTVGKVLAGDTAQPALRNHNADVFNSVGNSESGVPHGTPLEAGSLAAAREAPGAVVDRVGQALPEGNLDGPASIRAQRAGADITDPASQAQVANMRAQVAQSMTGPQRMQQLRQFRQEAYSRIANEGGNSVDQQAVGRAQLEMANSIEDHIGRNLPQNGNVSLEQYQAARKALAKNYTIENSLKGNDVDPAALARIVRADPGLLDGDLATAAKFANENRQVVGLPDRFNAPGVAKDISNVNPLKLGSLGSAATAGAGPALGRRLLTGGPAAGRATARAAAPGRLGDEFAPLEPQPPQPPPGMTAETPPPTTTPPAAARQNGIPLADVLSHGVEQEPPQGLTAGPMGAPRQEGIPFQRNAAHEAGDLSLGDMVADLHARYGAGSDVPAVMSQGVPEGTMMRTPQRPQGARMASAGKLGDMLANNASGESSASQEAINRGTRDLVQVDPDGNGSPLLRDVTQIDARAPKGHLIVDRSTGEIIDRGGLNQKMAEGLRNRYASRVRLGDNFAPPRD